MNYRLANSLAELIRNSLRQVDENIWYRQHIEKWYSNLIPTDWRMPTRNVCWVYDIRLKNVDTTRVVRELNALGIEARLGFKPVSSQPEYQHLGSIRQSPVAYTASREIIYLPVLSGMEWQDVAEIVDTLKTILPTPHQR